MRLEMNHAQSVICWLIISELAVGEEALLWFTGSRSLLKRSTLVSKLHLSFPNGLCDLHRTISVSMWSTGRRTQTSTKLARAPFYAKLADYVETFLLSNEELPTLGDFKIHMDVAGDSDAIKLSYLFQAVGLQWRVEQHTPHWRLPCVDRFLSDHGAFLLSLKSTKASLLNKTISYRKLTISLSTWIPFNLTWLSLIFFLSRNPFVALDDLAECYITAHWKLFWVNMLLSLRRSIKKRPRVPWFNDENGKHERR